MKVPAFILLACIISNFSAAQQTPKKVYFQSEKTAIGVFVKSQQDTALQAIRLIFLDQGDSSLYFAQTGENGFCTVYLPTGAEYQVKVIDFLDTLHYTSFTIPADRTDKFYKSPFFLHIQLASKRSYRMKTIGFDLNKFTLKAESYSEMNKIAKALSFSDSRRYEIRGYADSTGTEAHNLKLSLARAMEVRKYLIRKGISAQRLIAKGYGSLTSKQESETGNELQSNRRVEIVPL